MEGVNKSIPIIFEKMEEYDTRFTKVKIWLMHSGLNQNGSVFDKEDIEAAIPTLANTPILGYIENNKSGEKDFSDHRTSIERKDGQWNINYKCSAYGVIPENNNVKFELRMCDDGVEREFLTCEGLMWNKWDDPLDILNRDQSKSQSMEIHDDYEGEFDSEKHFHFKKFSFFGACILGDHIEPAMYNASVNKFNKDEIINEIKSNLSEFSKMINLKLPENGKEGGTEMKKDVKNKNFSNITAQQLAALFNEALNPNPEPDVWGYVSYNYYYVDHTDTMVIAYNTDNWGLVGLNYTMNGDIPVVDFASEVDLKVEYVPLDQGTTDTSATETEFCLVSKQLSEYMVNVAKKETEKEFSTKLTEEQSKFAEISERYTALESEAIELRTFQKDKLVDERKESVDGVIAQFTQLTEDEISPIRSEAYTTEISLQEIEQKLFALVGKKAFKTNNPTVTTFSKTEGSKTVKIGIPMNDDDGASDKPYAHIIRQYAPK